MKHDAPHQADHGHKKRRRDKKEKKKHQKHQQHKHQQPKRQRLDSLIAADQDAPAVSPHSAAAAPAPPTAVPSPSPTAAPASSSSDGTAPCTGFTAEAKARFPELTPGQWQKLEALGALVQEWNGKVNVISRKDIENVLPRHVLPCMGISKLLAKAPPGTKLMDVGTGGGFPGLPLAICCPHVHFWLVDSIGKKVKVVADMAARLGLKNVTARHTRVEEVKEKFYYITGRSVTAMPRFVGWVQDKFVLPPSPTSGMTPGSGILYIKGGISEENQEDLGGWTPTARYPISELIGGGVYDGDKSVLHFTVQDLKRGPKAVATAAASATATSKVIGGGGVHKKKW